MTQRCRRDACALYMFARLSILLVPSPAPAMRAAMPLALRSAQALRSPSQLPLARAGAVRLLSAEGPDRSVVSTCQEKISAALEPQEIKVQGAFDDPNGSHITIYCVSDTFEGKRSLARQQMVFKAIWEEMQGPVHAVDNMVLKAPSEL